jgi:Transposase
MQSIIRKLRGLPPCTRTRLFQERSFRERISAMWFAGIDWANAHHDIVIIDETGRQVGSRRVDHSPQGLNDLKTFLESMIGTEKNQVACIIETNQGLLNSALQEARYPVFPVNPKTDLIDAYWASKNRSSGFRRLATTGTR